MKNFVIIVGGIPVFEEIPKTTDTFWKETTNNKLVDGLDGGLQVKVYKHQVSNCIRLHYIKSNDEFIHILQQDEIIGDGIFRTRYANGDIVIGSQYYHSSGREEKRMYRLYRFIKSGNIRYYDQILEKTDSGWRYQAAYSFNPDTLYWTKINV